MYKCERKIKTFFFEAFLPLQYWSKCKIQFQIALFQSCSFFSISLSANDQRLYFHEIDSTIPILPNSAISSFIFCGCTAQSVSDLIRKPKTSFLTTRLICLHKNMPCGCSYVQLYLSYGLLITTRIFKLLPGVFAKQRLGSVYASAKSLMCLIGNGRPSFLHKNFKADRSLY